MNMKDTANRYGLVSILNHWAGAVLVFTLLIIGLQFEDLPRGEEKTALVALHMSIGILAFSWLAFRVVWRLLSGFPKEMPGPAWQLKTAKIVHWGLLAVIAVAILTGPLSVLANGRGIAVFDWFTLPALLPQSEALHQVLESVHTFTAKPLLMILLIVHIGAALKRALMDRDGTLTRMLRPASE